jgi:hypothetical protein
MTDRTANRIGLGLSVVVIAGILLGSGASLLGFGSLGILAVSAARPDILAPATARKHSKIVLLLAVALFVLEVAVTAVLKAKGIL